MKLPETFKNKFEFYYLNTHDKRYWDWNAHSDLDSKFIYFEYGQSDIIKYLHTTYDKHTSFIIYNLNRFLKDYE